MGTLSATIGGVSVSLMAGSFRTSETLNNRPIASFVLRYVTTPEGNEGDEVIVTRDSDADRVFAGRVQGITLNVDESGNANFATYQCGGYEVLADRRLVAEVYTNKTAGFIVDDIVTKYLAPDGVTAGTIEAGITIPRASFAYLSASQVLRELAEASGYIWYISYDKELFFVERDFRTAPHEIDATHASKRAYRSVVASANLNQYRNRQIVQYDELTSIRTETFAGDGERITFTVEYPVALVPTVSVNNIAQTVGIAGLGNDKDWYWSKGSNEITADILATPLAVDGMIATVADGADVPYLLVVRARGEYALATYHQSGTNNRGLVMLRMTPNSLDEVFRIAFPSDTVFNGVEALWIDDATVMVQYYIEGTNESVQKVFYREGDILVDSGASMNEAPTFTGLSNGRHIVSVESTFGTYNLLLWTWDASAGTIAETGSIAYDSAYGLPSTALEGLYAVMFKRNLTPFADSRMQLVKIASDDTFSVVDTVDLTGVEAGASVEMIGTYVFSLLDATPTSILIHKIDTATDTLTYVGSFAVPSQYTVNILEKYGNRLLLVGAFAGGDAVVVNFDPLTETLTLGGVLENEINGTVSVAQSGFGVYDRVAVGDDTVRLMRFVPDILSVTYQGSYPNVVQYDDLTAIASRASLEGGTGLYESFQSSSVVGEDEAMDVAQAIVARYGSVPRTVTLQTLIEGYETGMLVDINWPSLGIVDEEYLIERIDVTDESATNLWYTLRCISGRDIGNWQEFWRSLQPRPSFDFGGSEILPKGASVMDAIIIDETVTATTAAFETDWDEGNWDAMEWQ